MSPVGGSRHYQGAGLPQIGMWRCPSCAEDNEGPLEKGCVHCGAGRPADTPPKPPPAPRVSAREPEDPTYQHPPILMREEATEEQNEFTRWLDRHPGATLEQAFIAGYVEGVRSVRRAELARHPPPAAEPPMLDMAPGADAKTYRTVVAALAMFRDQILSTQPEEVDTGEWLSADEATSVIGQIQQLLAVASEGVHG